MTTYHVTARRSGRWWALQCDELPEAISQVARLDQAEEWIREAIGYIAGVPEDSFDVLVSPVVPDAYRQARAEAERLRAAAAEANGRAAEESRKAARVLAGMGLTLRDIGTVMGVSHQRAAQLIA